MWNWDLIVFCAYRSESTFIKFLKGKHFVETLWNVHVCTGWIIFRLSSGKNLQRQWFSTCFHSTESPWRLNFFRAHPLSENLKKNLDKQIFSSKAFKNISARARQVFFLFPATAWSERNCWMNFGDLLWKISRYCRFYECLEIDLRYEWEWVFGECKVSGSHGKMSKFGWIEFSDKKLCELRVGDTTTALSV